ncbi:hypothetical protein WJX74_005224 [Apatococcus lobatus]|uniref:Geranylgeranyl transferase type-2 subunit alpha n=1 Tax=Apatococcus lobatus TaxID=904363 RepID=A0AAW1QWE4_9CHLO
MHGRPRYPRPNTGDPQKLQAAEQRVQLYSRLTSTVLKRLQAGQYDKETLDLAARLLEQNPEVYTVWNHRKRALLATLSKGGDTAAEAVKAELALTQRALEKHPKSYATWHHRRWLVAQHVTSLQQEVDLVNRLLEADERNFHGWGYRQFLMELMQAAPEDEEAYAAAKIDHNFSNYSAWHLKTRLLKKVHHQSPTVTLDDLISAKSSAAAAEERLVPFWALRQELELVTQAFYTDPGDQSPWLYHRWLLGCLLAHAQTGKNKEEIVSLLQQEVAVCKDILELEDTAAPDGKAASSIKWPSLTLAQLHELLCSVAPSSFDNEQTDVRLLYRQLQDIDQLRAGFYTDASKGSAKILVQSAT